MAECIRDGSPPCPQRDIQVQILSLLSVKVKMGKLDEIEIDRVYRCTNKKCSGVIAVTQKIFDQFIKICPFCEKESLIMQSADCGITMLVEPSVAKTWGTQAEVNTKRRENEREVAPKKKFRPFWRNSDIDYKILKNPQKFIYEGKI